MGRHAQTGDVPPEGAGRRPTARRGMRRALGRVPGAVADAAVDAVLERALLAVVGALVAGGAVALSVLGPSRAGLLASGAAAVVAVAAPLTVAAGRRWRRGDGRPPGPTAGS